MEQQERRLSQRKTFEHLTYIDMPGGNGGIVTDVSEGGLGFHVVSPLRTPGPVHFLLSSCSNRISCAGNVMWIHEDGKSGGLSFTEVPNEIRDQIGNWPFRTNLRLDLGPRESAAPAHMTDTYPRSAAGKAADPDESQPLPGLSLPQGQPASYARYLKTIGISSLAALVGALSYFYYREAHKGPEHSNTRGLREHSSELVKPAAPNSDAEIALLQSAPQKSDVSAETLPDVPQAAAETSSKTLPSAEPQQAAVPPSHSPAAAPGSLFVQVAAVTREADADKIVAALRQHNFTAFISLPAGDGFYRVQLGPYQTPEAARAALKALEEAGYKPFLRH